MNYVPCMKTIRTIVFAPTPVSASMLLCVTLDHNLTFNLTHNHDIYTNNSSVTFPETRLFEPNRNCSRPDSCGECIGTSIPIATTKL